MTDDKYREWVREYVAAMRRDFAPPVGGDTTEYTLKFLGDRLENADGALATAFPGEVAPSNDILWDVGMEFMLHSDRAQQSNAAPTGGPTK